MTAAVSNASRSNKTAQRVTAPVPKLGRGGLRAARLTKPHGLKGGIKLELYTDSPEQRFIPGAIFHLQVPTDSPWFGRTLSVRQLRWFSGSPVAFFHEVSDRRTAESVVRAILWIDKATVHANPEQDAWYDQQLVGLQVHHNGIHIGDITEVQHLPAQDLLTVATAHGAVLVPFVSAIVPEVDIAAGIVRVTPPAGLFETFTSAPG